MRWFGCVYDGPISFPDGEVAEARWVEWPEFAALLATEIWCPDSITLGLSIVLARLGMATLHNP